MSQTTSILINHSIVQGTGSIVSDMDKEKVMLSIHNGKYYNLGVIGGRIWDLIESPKTVSQVVDALTTEYDVEHNKCREQVTSFLDLLLSEGLIEVQDKVTT